MDATIIPDEPRGQGTAAAVTAGIDFSSPEAGRASMFSDEPTERE